MANTRQQIERMQLLDLHDQALLVILDYLDLDDLYNTYQVNHRLRQLITSHRIYKEMITLQPNENGELDPFILDMLPYAKKLTFHLNGRYSRQVIEEIVSRCGDGQLKEVIIFVDGYNPDINNKSQQFAKKMKNLESLTVDMAGWNFRDQNILLLIKNEGLNNITFINMSGPQYFSIQSFIPLKNLIRLEISECYNVPYDEFNKVLKIIGGQLKEFAWEDSTFTRPSDILKLCGMIAAHMPNLIVLRLMKNCMDHNATANIGEQTIFDNLLTLSKLRSLHIDYKRKCICNNFNVFLNRLCALRQIENFCFSWDYLFSSSGICSETNTVITPIQCQNLQLIPRLSLGCSLPLAEWSQIEDILPSLREFYFMNPMDFDIALIRDQFTYILRNGHKLESLDMIEFSHLTSEFYEVLVMICKLYRNGKGITIKCEWMNCTNLLRDLKDCYRSEYVRFQICYY